MDAYFLSKRLRNLTFGFFPVVIFSIAALGHEAFAIELPWDLVAPVSTLDMGSYASGTWSSGPVNLTFSCTDNESGSGCAPAYPLHCVDRTNTCTPEESGSTLALTESGTWYVRYFSQDLAENTEEIQSQIVHIACGAACDVASPYAKTTILPDGKWSPWEWNDAKDTYFWFNGDAQHEDGNIHVYTKNDDRFIYALYDVVPDITNEPDVECYTASGCDWATLNISYDGEDYNCTIWSNGTSDGCSGVSFQDGFSGTVNSATPHRFWEFKLDLGYFEIPEGATVKVTAGGYGTLSERRTGYPWTYPERICSSGTCAELESTAQNGFDLTLNTPFTTTPNVAWSFVVSSDSESENKCGGNILDAALFDQNGSGLKDFSILTQPGRMLYSAYSINGNDGSQIWVNHDYHGDRLAVGNVYNKSSGDETIVGDMTDGSRIVVLSNTGAYLADFSDITGRITSIRLADLDSDGVMEIVLGTNTSIYVLKVTENDEWIGFTSLWYVLVPVSDIAIGDANNDGKDEIVTIGYGEDATIHVYNLNDGLNEMARYEVDGQVVRIADIDGDGKNEIIAGVYAREEGQDINIDTEGIAAFRYATVENNEFPWELQKLWFVPTESTIVDIQIGSIGDAKLAAITEGQERRKTVYLLKGDGSIVWLKPYTGFNPDYGKPYTSGAPRGIEQLAIGDIDNDGANDLVIADYNDNELKMGRGRIYAFHADATPIWRYTPALSEDECISNAVFDVGLQPTARGNNVFATIGNTLYSFGTKYTPPTSGGGGGGGMILKDVCPNGDTSGSPYDGTCGMKSSGGGGSITQTGSTNSGTGTSTGSGVSQNTQTGITATGGAMVCGAYKTFKDIESSYAKEDIYKLIRLCVLNGYDDGTFKPGKSTSRGEFLAIAMRVMGIPLSTATGTTYTDFSSGSAWLIPYVEKAKDYGITGQTVDGKSIFRPDAPISKIEALVILFKLQSLKLDATKMPKYSDHFESWMIPYVAKAHELRLLSGKLVKWKLFFAPNDPLSRAETARVVVKALKVK